MVDILGSIDEKIENNSVKINDNNININNDIFLILFVDIRLIEF